MRTEYKNQKDKNNKMATHPSLRDVVSNLSLLAHVVSRNYKCPLNIDSSQMHIEKFDLSLVCVYNDTGDLQCR